MQNIYSPNRIYLRSPHDNTRILIKMSIYITAWKNEFSSYEILWKRQERSILEMGISYFLNFPSNENVRKQHLSASAYFCVNMKFSYKVAGRKHETFCPIVTKTSNFLLVFRSAFCWRYLSKTMIFSVALQQKQAIGQLFIKDVYIFPLISCRKRDRRITYLFFSTFMLIKPCSLQLIS